MIHTGSFPYSPGDYQRQVCSQRMPQSFITRFVNNWSNLEPTAAPSQFKANFYAYCGRPACCLSTLSLVNRLPTFACNYVSLEDGLKLRTYDVRLELTMVCQTGYEQSLRMSNEHLRHFGAVGPEILQCWGDNIDFPAEKHWRRLCVNPEHLISAYGYRNDGITEHNGKMSVKYGLCLWVSDGKIAQTVDFPLTRPRSRLHNFHFDNRIQAPSYLDDEIEDTQNTHSPTVKPFVTIFIHIYPYPLRIADCPLRLTKKLDYQQGDYSYQQSLLRYSSSVHDGNDSETISHAVDIVPLSGRILLTAVTSRIRTVRCHTQKPILQQPLIAENRLMEDMEWERNSDG
ncbi:hypothetical protein CSKR_100880 [Clonorchis sinensis]|uniref:Uncharacterized protein n=2 Tax=Clonorchis sinensis TaxID=79923 RepID=A0A8T1MGP9_CLOSI|nr:hypothetical protein CSKR_100880 [Clonorchis sinensis]GAA48960.1 hypothetical protein CLF_102268 [Clonorchis sinensis]